MKRCFMLLPLLITCMDLSAQNNDVAPSTEKGDVYTMVEQMPEFPGGLEGLMEYLTTSVQYPKSAKADTVQGKVLLRFVVNVLGEVQDITVVKSVRADLDQAAVDAVAAMPKWDPGRQEGKAVNVQYILPVNFKL